MYPLLQTERSARWDRRDAFGSTVCHGTQADNPASEVTTDRKYCIYKREGMALATAPLLSMGQLIRRS